MDGKQVAMLASGRDNPLWSREMTTEERLKEIEERLARVSELAKRFPHSPLRYPGGKNRAIKAIYSIIPQSERKLCSPFLGGASIELACTTRMQVYGYQYEPISRRCQNEPN